MGKRQLCLTGFVLGSAACTGHPEVGEDMIPVAKNVTIYSAGGSVVTGVIDATSPDARRLRLPATASAINLSQGDQTLKWFTVETKKDATFKLIGLPALGSG